MAGCYVCDKCGRCRLVLGPESKAVLVCVDCGMKISPGKSAKACESCGSDNICNIGIKYVPRPSRSG